MKKTILVTGGTGFIGSHTTVELQNAGYNVVIIDNLSNSKADVVDGIEKITGIRPAFEQVDCCDLEALEGVFNKYPEITGIIHFAASKAVGESVQKPLLYYRNNIVSLVNLLELMPHVLKELADALSEITDPLEEVGLGSLINCVCHFHTSFLLVGTPGNYLVSLCAVCFLQNGQYLLSSILSGVFFLFL